jgi:di/tricarboxylate transporter
MAAIDLVNFVGLLLIFVVGTFTSANLGALAFVAAFMIGMIVLSEDVDTLLSGFPIDLFMLIFGVTYFFGIASVNGTLDWLVHRLVAQVRGRSTFVPPLMFLLVSAAASAGALAPSVVAVFAPLALRLARQLNISRLLVAIMVAQGANAGALTPIGGLGPLVNGVVERNGLVLDPITLFALNYAFNATLAVAAYVLLDSVPRLRTRLRRSRSADLVVSIAGHADSDTTRPGKDTAAGASRSSAPGGPSGSVDLGGEWSETPRLNAARVCTLVGITALAVGILVFGLDIGLLSLTMAVLLQLAFPSSSKGALDRVSWSVIVLICGVVTFVGMMERAGTIDAAGVAIAGLTPVLAVLLLGLAAAFVSAFASSAGTIAAIVPLALPLVASAGMGGTAVIVAIAICTVVVDSSPLSSTGALAVASAKSEEQPQIFRGLLRWALSIVVVAPIVTTGALLLL